VKCKTTSSRIAQRDKCYKIEAASESSRQTTLLLFFFFFFVILVNEKRLGPDIDVHPSASWLIERRSK
jgi:hypothetical protein